MTIRSSLLAFTCAAVVASAFGTVAHAQAVTGDPRNSGVIPHELPPVDPFILSDPKIALPGIRSTPSRTPVVTTPVASASAPASSPATGPEPAATTTAPIPATGPETQNVSPVVGDAYPIKFDRPLAAGFPYDTTITVENTTPDLGPPPAGGPRKWKVDLAGRVTVSAVGPKGNPTEFSLKVSKFNVDGKDAAPANTVILHR